MSAASNGALPANSRLWRWHILYATEGGEEKWMESKLLTYDKAWRESEARRVLGYKVEVKEDAAAVEKYNLAQKAKAAELAAQVESRRRRGG